VLAVPIEREARSDVRRLRRRDRIDHEVMAIAKVAADEYATGFGSVSTVLRERPQIADGVLSDLQDAGSRVFELNPQCHPRLHSKMSRAHRCSSITVCSRSGSRAGHRLATTSSTHEIAPNIPIETP
jgi:hypothetical protein